MRAKGPQSNRDAQGRHAFNMWARWETLRQPFECRMCKATCAQREAIGDICEDCLLAFWPDPNELPETDLEASIKRANEEAMQRLLTLAGMSGGSWALEGESPLGAAYRPWAIARKLKELELLR